MSCEQEMILIIIVLHLQNFIIICTKNNTTKAHLKQIKFLFTISWLKENFINFSTNYKTLN